MTEHTADPPAPSLLGRFRLDRSTVASRPAVLLVALALLVGFGTWLRFVNQAFPAGMSFDEHHFVKNARNYLTGQADWNDHPPLGKLLIALSIRLFGDTGVAWRVPSLVAGCFTPIAGAAIARLSFRSWLAAAVTLALFAVDGFFIAYSHTAVLDGVLTALALAATWTALAAKGRFGVFASAALAGLCASIKFSGLGAFVVPAIVLARRDASVRRRALELVGAGALFLLVYWAAFAVGLRMIGAAWGPLDVAETTIRLVKGHARATSMEHPLTSAWSTWPVPTRPLVLAQAAELGQVRMLSALPNLAIWWASWLVVLAGVAAAAWSGASWMSRQRDAESRSFLRAHGAGWLPLIASWLAFIAPWIITKRDSYIYHYLPCHAYAVIGLGGFVAHLRRVRPTVAFGFVLLAGVVAAFYAPIWAALPVNESGIDARLFVSTWR